MKKLSVTGASHLREVIKRWLPTGACLAYNMLLLFYCVVQCRGNGDNCMYTVLNTAVPEWTLVIKEHIIIAAGINISINNLIATKSSDTVYKCLEAFSEVNQSQAQFLSSVRSCPLMGA